MTAAIETTLHAYDRYREHHADASEADLIAAIRAGEPVDADLVWALTQRTRKPDPTDTFRIAPDQWGIFVMSGATLITYLRLGPAQRSVLTGEPLPGGAGVSVTFPRGLQVAASIEENEAPSKQEVLEIVAFARDLYAKHIANKQALLKLEKARRAMKRLELELAQARKQHNKEANKRAALAARLRKIQKALTFADGDEL